MKEVTTDLISKALKSDLRLNSIHSRVVLL
jgi:hypothetical protein